MSGVTRRRINLIYQLASALDPLCEIQRDPLHRRYEVNRGVYIRCATKAATRQLRVQMLEALVGRGVMVAEDAMKASPKTEILVGRVEDLPNGTHRFEVYPS